jgi:hypothetical protein
VNNVNRRISEETPKQKPCAVVAGYRFGLMFPAIMLIDVYPPAPLLQATVLI